MISTALKQTLENHQEESLISGDLYDPELKRVGIDPGPDLPDSESPEETPTNSDPNETNEPRNTLEKLNIMIDGLTGEMITDLQAIREEIAPLIAGLDGALPEFFVTRLKEKTGLSKTALRMEIKLAEGKLLSEGNPTSGTGGEQEEPDPEVMEKVDCMKLDPLIFKKRIDAVNQLGLAGERKTIGQIVMVMDSCLIPRTSGGAQVLAAKLSGPFGTGKSRSTSSCLALYPKDRFHLITSGSSKSLYNIPGGLKHKVLVLVEAHVLDTFAGGDSELAYAVRSLISEGDLVYQYTSFDDKGKKATVMVKMEGPTALLTTSIKGHLEPQLEDRLITIRPDTSREQTRDILLVSAQEASGKRQGLDETEKDAWVHYHKSLEPADVVIPFAKDLVLYITRNDSLPIAARRAFGRVLSAIKSIAIFHQHQRSRDEDGRIIADTADYFLAYQLMDDCFRESLGEGTSYTDSRLKLVEKLGPISLKDLAKIENISVPSLTEWVNLRLPKGIIVWCDREGNLFLDKVALDKAKHSGKAFINVAHPCGLPTPFELTGDSRWIEGGEFLEMYDLRLGIRAASMKGKLEPHEEIPDPVEQEDPKEDEISGDRVFGRREEGTEKGIADSEISAPYSNLGMGEQNLLIREFVDLLKRPDLG